MNSFDKLKLRVSASGSTEREEKIKDAQKLIEIENTKDVSFCDTLTRWNTEIKVNARLFERKFSSSTGNSIKFQTLTNEPVIVGDIVYNSKDKTYWMCTESHYDYVRYFGKLIECNYTLKFQSLDGTILSYPCIDETTNTVGIDENNTITTLNGIHRIKLPFDDNTKLIREDRRFFIDKSGTTTAKVTDVNNIEFNYGDKGLIELTLQKDSAYNPVTDKNGVCNYFEPTTPPTPDPSPTGSTLTISSSGDFNLGTTRTLTPTLKDSSGNVVVDWVAVWTVNYNGMDQNYFTVTYVENQCKVAISEEAYDVIDGVLELTCTVSGDTVSGTYSGIITA